MSRRRTAGLFVCLFLLLSVFGSSTAASADDANTYPRTLDDIVAQLRQDPVMVHTAMGTGTPTACTTCSPTWLRRSTSPSTSS
ncbi:hypothetical protein [Aeromicrobium sp. UC242_57]|uniref:hypothetical protein n=1 Tax=Aeromicrobium sp. UC242_57 TaxID=3374624 RepID=UPI00379D34C0